MHVSKDSMWWVKEEIFWEVNGAYVLDLVKMHGNFVASTKFGVTCTPSVQKTYNNGLRTDKSNLIKFLMTTIHICASKLIY
jgi:hypothetical protein